MSFSHKLFLEAERRDVDERSVGMWVYLRDLNASVQREHMKSWTI